MKHFHYGILGWIVFFWLVVIGSSLCIRTKKTSLENKPYHIGGSVQ